MAIRATCVPIFSAHLPPSSRRLITTWPHLLARPPHLAFSGAATFVHQTQLRASSSAFCACVSTFLVDLEPLVRCVNGLTCVDRSASSRASKLQWTSRSEPQLRHETKIDVAVAPHAQPYSPPNGMASKRGHHRDNARTHSRRIEARPPSYTWPTHHHLGLAPPRAVHFAIFLRYLLLNRATYE